MTSQSLVWSLLVLVSACDSRRDGARRTDGGVTHVDANCAPACGTLECGVDPVCGTSCGSCEGEESCLAGMCQVIPCTTREECPLGAECVEGLCRTVACIPACGDRTCGPDPVCGMSCGTCTEGVCDESGRCGGGGTLCGETCTYSGDGECDDGGEGAVTSVCEYGTDCIDCGPRTACTPSCGGRTCGSDGCGGTCGVCEGECIDGVCSSGSSVRMGARCDLCDEIWETTRNCFVSGDPSIREVCGGVSGGDPADVAWCRRGPLDTSGYCTISCTSSCPEGYTCEDTTIGSSACVPFGGS
jgi:hypothetical protein